MWQLKLKMEAELYKELVNIRRCSGFETEDIPAIFGLHGAGKTRGMFNEAIQNETMFYNLPT